MTALLDLPETTNRNSSANRLRITMAAVRVMFTWLGARRTLTQEQKSQAADTFGAERAYLSAGVQRDARGAGAADRHGRGAEGHQQFGG